MTNLRASSTDTSSKLFVDICVDSSFFEIGDSVSQIFGSAVDINPSIDMLIYVDSRTCDCESTCRFSVDSYSPRTVDIGIAMVDSQISYFDSSITTGDTNLSKCVDPRVVEVVFITLFVTDSPRNHNQALTWSQLLTIKHLTIFNELRVHIKKLDDMSHN